MKIGETFRRHPKIGIATTLALGLVAAELVGVAKSPTHDIPEGACVSPPAVSPVYVEPGTNLLLQTYTGLFTTGVVASGTVEGAYGVRPSFKHPTAGEHAWEEHAGPMTKANAAGHYALKFAIGDGKVRFGLQMVAPAGSEQCNTPPTVTYTHHDRSEYLTANGTPAIPNFVTVVTNLVGNIS